MAPPCTPCASPISNFEMCISNFNPSNVTSNSDVCHFEPSPRWVLSMLCYRESIIGLVDLIQGLALVATFINTLMRMNTSKTRALAGAKDPDQALSFSIYTRFLQLTCLWAAFSAGYKLFQTPEGAPNAAVAHAVGYSVMSELGIALESSICIYLLVRSVGRNSQLVAGGIFGLINISAFASNLYFYIAFRSDFLQTELKPVYMYEIWKNGIETAAYALICALSRFQKHSSERGLVRYSLFLATYHGLKVISYALLFNSYTIGFFAEFLIRLAFYALFGKVIFVTLLEDSRYWQRIMTGQLNRPVGSIQAEDVPLSESLIPYNQLLLLRNLSHGGGGTVDLYLWIGRTVAVKKLVLQMMTSAYLDGFAREASIQREFSHPNVVQFLGVYFDPPRLGIVMEYCPHGSLFHVLQGRGQSKTPLDLTTSSFHPLKIAIDICKGLQYLQSLKLIHRDIKSLNILLDDKWTAKIADFGECLRFADHAPEGSIKATSSSAFSSNSDYMSISSQSDSAFESLSNEESALRRRRASTRAGIANGSIRGTAAYMAPELLAVEPISFKTDVFSFAIVFWELLTCRAPFVRVPKPAAMPSVVVSSSVSLATSAMPARRSSDVALVALSRSLDSRGEGESFLALNFTSTASSGGGASSSGSVRRPRSSVFSSAASSTRDRNQSAASNGSTALPSSLGSHSNANALFSPADSSPFGSSVAAVESATSALSDPADASHAANGVTPNHRRVSTIVEGPDSAAGASISPAVADSSLESEAARAFDRDEGPAKPASVRAPVSIRAAAPLMLPIDDYDSEDVFVTNITLARTLVEEQNLRPPLPRDAPADLLELLQQCWHRNPEQRPSFDTIVTQLERFLIATDVTRAFAAYPFSTDR